MSWVRDALNMPELGLAALPAILLLGVALAIGSSCNWPALAIMAGYAGSQAGLKRSHAVAAGVGFMLGTIASLMALGAAIGVLGSWGGARSIRIAKLVGGFLVILLGLFGLGLAPFRFPSFRLPLPQSSGGLLGASAIGFVVGSMSMVSTGACATPLLPAAFGIAHLKTRWLLGSAGLVAFSAGYSVPVFAALVGVGLGRMSSLASRIGKPIQYLSAGLMVLTGFWLLSSV